MVVLPQKVPAPETTTAAGNGLTVTVTEAVAVCEQASVIVRS